MSNSSAGRIIVLTAPSGGGKTSVAKRLLEAFPQMSFSVSATTRPPRPGEVDGTDYHFLTPQQFRDELARDGLVEHEEVYPDRYYGTLRKTVDQATAESPVILDIEVVGARNVKAMFGDEALTVFLMPPSLDVLEERLRNRGTETEESLRVRLDRARMEIQQADRFDHVIVNDQLERACRETIRVIGEFLHPGVAQ